MESLLKEIKESLDLRRKGVKSTCWIDHEWKDIQVQPSKGKGTKAYTIRRIDMLQDQLKQLKKDIQNGKYDFKESR